MPVDDPDPGNVIELHELLVAELPPLAGLALEEIGAVRGQLIGKAAVDVEVARNRMAMALSVSVVPQLATYSEGASIPLGSLHHRPEAGLGRQQVRTHPVSGDATAGGQCLTRPFDGRERLGVHRP